MPFFGIFGICLHLAGEQLGTIDRPGTVVANYRCAVRREFVILHAGDAQLLAVLHDGNVVDVVVLVADHSDVAVLYLGHHARGETLRQWITPFSVSLADGRGISLEFHVVVATENYARAQTGAWRGQNFGKLIFNTTIQVLVKRRIE